MGGGENSCMDAGSRALCAPVRIAVLGGFRVLRAGVAVPDSAWMRRNAKRLVKLLAIEPTHTLHKEQVIELLWPNYASRVARNHLAKVLHAARSAVDPERTPRDQAAFLGLREDLIFLNNDRVRVDCDHFQLLADEALQQQTMRGYVAALRAYTGGLLPEDRYEDWCFERREQLAELRTALLVGSADVLEQEGAHARAIDRLKEVVKEDPTREDVHRRLMKLYAAVGARGLVSRQFEICRTALREELGVTPDKTTEALYRRLSASDAGSRPAAWTSRSAGDPRQRLKPPLLSVRTRMFGRDSELGIMNSHLAQADSGRGRMLVLTGEVGVGKTRLLDEFGASAQSAGMTVLSERRFARGQTYGPFTGAVERHVARWPTAERAAFAVRYPGLEWLPPLYAVAGQSRPVDGSLDESSLYVGIELVRVLSDLAKGRTLVVCLGDLDDADSTTLTLLPYLAQLAPQHRWLIVGAVRHETLGASLTSTRRLQCHRLELGRLQPHDFEMLVRTSLAGGTVDNALVDHISKLSRGNPLFGTDLLTEMRTQRRLVLSDGRWHERSPLLERLPPRTQARVAAALAALDSDVRRLLDLAALAGIEFSGNQLRADAGRLDSPITGTDFDDALERLLCTRILDTKQDRYAFAHPLVHRMLLDGQWMRQSSMMEAALGR